MEVLTMAKPCEYGDGACTAPNTNCRFWNGVSCDLNVDTMGRRVAKTAAANLADRGGGTPAHCAGCGSQRDEGAVPKMTDYTRAEGADDLNTKIGYLYRDADNYKMWNECVVEGEITPEQIATIMECLDDGENFVPHMVGLPERKFETFDPQADTPFFEIAKNCFTSTEEEPTVDVTVPELVAAFLRLKGNWSSAFHTTMAEYYGTYTGGGTVNR